MIYKYYLFRNKSIHNLTDLKSNWKNLSLNNQHLIISNVDLLFTNY